jgi:hypothetical protein
MGSRLSGQPRVYFWSMERPPNSDWIGGQRGQGDEELRQEAMPDRLNELKVDSFFFFLDMIQINLAELT